MKRSTIRFHMFAGAAAAALLLAAAPGARAQARDFDIARQPLANALLDFGDQAGATVAVAPGLIEGKVAPAVVGAMEPDEALAKLLNGAGLRFAQTAHGAYTITLASAAAPAGSGGRRPVRLAQAGTGSPRGAAPETAPAAREQRLDTLMVTAQRRAQNIQDVPISITAFDENRINEIGATDLGELSFATPNFRIENNGSGVRGVSSQSRNIGSDARLAVYIDGVYQGRAYAGNQDLQGIERVEILKGPQGTLYGRNSSIGALNVTTRAPGDEYAAELIAEAGNYEFFRVLGRVDLPLATDKASLALSLAHTGRNGFVDNITLDKDVDTLNRTSARAALRLTPNDSLEVRLIGDFLTTDERNSAFIATAGAGFDAAPDIREVAHDADTNRSRDVWGVSGTVDYRFADDHVLTSITAYREASFDNNLNEEDFSPAFVAVSNLDESSEQFTQELRIASPQDRRLNYVAGAFFLDQQLETRRSAATGPVFPLGAGEVTTPGALDLQSVALFADASFALTDQIELNAGVRWTREEQEINYSIVDTTGLFLNVNEFQDDRTDTDVSPKFGVNYKPTDNILFYATYAQAFASGGYNADFLSTLEQIEFDSEKARNVEAGFKSVLLERRILFNASYFNTNFDDFQVFRFIQTIGSGTILALTNAGEVTTQGVEAELVVNPFDALTLTASGAYTDAVFDSFPDGGGIGVDFDGNRLDRAPEFEFYVSANYEAPLANGGRLTLFGDFSYTDGYFVNPDNLPENFVDGFGVASARLSYSDPTDRYELSLWVQNLADNGALTLQNRSFLGVPRATFLEPRTWGVRLIAGF